MAITHCCLVMMGLGTTEVTSMQDVITACLSSVQPHCSFETGPLLLRVDHGSVRPLYLSQHLDALL